MSRGKWGGVECVVYADNVLPKLSEPMSERSHKDKDTFLPCLLVLECVDASNERRRAWGQRNYARWSRCGPEIGTA